VTAYVTQLDSAEDVALDTFIVSRQLAAAAAAAASCYSSQPVVAGIIFKAQPPPF
jgi:hypothetical protein